MFFLWVFFYLFDFGLLGKSDYHHDAQAEIIGFSTSVKKQRTNRFDDWGNISFSVLLSSGTLFVNLYEDLSTESQRSQKWLKNASLARRRVCGWMQVRVGCSFFAAIASTCFLNFHKYFRGCLYLFCNGVLHFYLFFRICLSVIVKLWCHILRCQFT